MVLAFIIVCSVWIAPLIFFCWILRWYLFFACNVRMTRISLISKLAMLWIQRRGCLFQSTTTNSLVGFPPIGVSWCGIFLHVDSGIWIRVATPILAQQSLWGRFFALSCTRILIPGLFLCTRKNFSIETVLCCCLKEFSSILHCVPSTIQQFRLWNLHAFVCGECGEGANDDKDQC